MKLRFSLLATLLFLGGLLPDVGAVNDPHPVINLPSSPTYEDMLEWAFRWEYQTWSRISPDDPISPVKLNKPAIPGGKPYWPMLIQMDSLSRALKQMEDMIERLAHKGIDVSDERVELESLRKQVANLKRCEASDPTEVEKVFLTIRHAKRNLMMRDLDLASLKKVLFVKRFPYEPSHNYSDHLDSKFIGGGSICILDIPQQEGRLRPEQGVVSELYDAGNGIPRDPVADYDAKKIYFSFRPPGQVEKVYWNLMEMNVDGTELRQLTEGSFHDYYPCPLPDGDLVFVSTRIGCRFLCWVPRAFTLFRMNIASGEMKTLSDANLTEWSPTMMRDGRILWTRSEYLDKGANFGHTLWAIHPDGTHPELVYGNNTKNCMLNAHEVPGTREIVSVMISHFGDFNGPIGLIDPEQGRYNPDAVTNITPDVGYGYDCHWAEQGNKYTTWPDRRCFRDPFPVSTDYILVSHSPSGDWNSPSHLFGLYVIDRYGNRELLYLDPRIGCMSPTILQPRSRPPILASTLASDNKKDGQGEFILSDVYAGLEPMVPRGRIKYLRICEEIKDYAEEMPDGRLRESFVNFTDFYASPIFSPVNGWPGSDGKPDVIGPFGWPPYEAKGVEGLVPVEADGSARFLAPAGKVLYFQVLDDDLNEIQRMRSVVQIQSGETRSCIGCHEDRRQAPTNKTIHAMNHPPNTPESPPWGKGPFGYEDRVQPIFDNKCVSCHGPSHEKGVDLSGRYDDYTVPASYRTLITKGLVHYVDCNWGAEHTKNDPMTFGVLKSRLIQVIESNHHHVQLSPQEMHAIKCWIDLNCPLWADYMERKDRSANIKAASAQSSLVER
jgi:hypothetical protein